MTFHEPEVTEDQGLYPKYVVFRHPKREVYGFSGKANITPDQTSIGGRPQIPLELDEGFSFVLKPLKDRHARLALAVYAEAVRAEKPRLAAEIKEWLDDFQGS